MGTDLRYGLINTFSVIDRFRQNVLFNLQGAVTPGFNRKNTQLNVASSLTSFSDAAAGGNGRASRVGIRGGPSELRISAVGIDFVQGGLTQRVGKTANLAISDRAQGHFFAVAESLRPGARVLLTRDGDFQWEEQKNAKATGGNRTWLLKNSTNLYVLRAEDIESDPDNPGFMRVKQLPPGVQPGMMTSTAFQRDAILKGPTGSDPLKDALQWEPDRIRGVIGFTGDPFTMGPQEKANPLNNNSALAIVKVPSQSTLSESAFGGAIYETSIANRGGITVESYGARRAKGAGGDFLEVQSESLEQPDFNSIERESNITLDVANFVYKNLTKMLDDYNSSLDQLINLVK
ncbi:MAG: hypothetical protein VKO21_01360 [Candidatus Sericytochromatia bacterium]|nr:hypothetical protein [Candidatus Sericytochromatia bacterium]